MSLWLLHLLRRFLAAVHSGQQLWQLALGFTLGMMMGFPPFNVFYVFFIFFFVFILNVNMGMAFFGMLVFTFVSYFLDPVAHSLGYFLLMDVSWLTPVWTFLYHMPIVPYSNFYNSVMMGGMALSVLMFVPVFGTAYLLFFFYRRVVAKRLENTKLYRTVMMSKVVQWYQKVTA